MGSQVPAQPATISAFKLPFHISTPLLNLTSFLFLSLFPLLPYNCLMLLQVYNYLYPFTSLLFPPLLFLLVGLKFQLSTVLKFVVLILSLQAPFPYMMMEITVLSAQGLKRTSTIFFSKRLRPFITVATYQPEKNNGDKSCHVYTTRVDDRGGVNPTWGDKFYLPIGNSFFANRYSCIYLTLYTKRFIGGQTLLGWCHIPVNDIGFPQPGLVRHMSYRVRDRDGSRGRGVVNVAMKLEYFEPVAGVIGIPAGVYP